MAEVKMTKNELRSQQYKLTQLLKYLPTLQLKKSLLQLEVQEARQEIVHLEKKYEHQKTSVDEFSALFTDYQSIDPALAAKVHQVKRRYENIAGVEVPYFESISFEDYSYDFFTTPPWVDSAVEGLRDLVAAYLQVTIAREKKEALEKELREVSIRVNLFEKILIPRALRNIKKIRVFLGDLQLAAVSQAKTAKNKIEERKKSLQKDAK